MTRSVAHKIYTQ